MIIPIFFETFVYRGIPTKYFNLDYDTIIRTGLKGPRRPGYDPMNEDENQNNDEMDTNSVHGSVHNSVYNSPAPSERSHLSLQNLHANPSLQESVANPHLHSGSKASPAYSHFSDFSDFKFESPASRQDRLSGISLNSHDFSPASIQPHTPAGTPHHSHPPNHLHLLHPQNHLQQPK